jgi:hypothetical protein
VRPEDALAVIVAKLPLFKIAQLEPLRLLTFCPSVGTRETVSAPPAAPIERHKNRNHRAPEHEKLHRLHA